MFNHPYLSQTLPYPFLNLFGDTSSIPIQEQDEDENEENENEENENEESVAE
jgi:hypothetical protein